MIKGSVRQTTLELDNITKEKLFVLKGNLFVLKENLNRIFRLGNDCSFVDVENGQKYYDIIKKSSQVYQYLPGGFESDDSVPDELLENLYLASLVEKYKYPWGYNVVKFLVNNTSHVFTFPVIEKQKLDLF